MFNVCTYKLVPISFMSLFLAVMRKDLLKIKKHSSELLVERSQTNPQDVKLHNDVEVSFLACNVKVVHPVYQIW